MCSIKNCLQSWIGVVLPLDYHSGGKKPTKDHLRWFFSGFSDDETRYGGTASLLRLVSRPLYSIFYTPPPAWREPHFKVCRWHSLCLAAVRRPDKLTWWMQQLQEKKKAQFCFCSTESVLTFSFIVWFRTLWLKSSDCPRWCFGSAHGEGFGKGPKNSGRADPLCGRGLPAASIWLKAQKPTGGYLSCDRLLKVSAILI